MSSERIMNLLVTIPAESRRMNVGKDVIRILGSPAYICILQRKDRQSIAITPCAAEHPMSFKVPDKAADRRTVPDEDQWSTVRPDVIRGKWSCCRERLSV